MKKLLLCSVIATSMFIAVPSQAVIPNVDVTLKVATAHYSHVETTCVVTVQKDSNGLAVFNAAVAKGCIESYATKTDPTYGAYVTCIDGLCEVPGTYWAMRENCIYTDYGIDGYKAGQGEELSFTYESWAHFLLPPPCS